MDAYGTDGIRDVRWDEASFFPEPSPMFREDEGWREMTGGYMRAWEWNGLKVIASVGIQSDGREWLHVSFSRARRLPSYADLKLVKREFIGDDKKAVMVFPERENYVDIHPYCLHLWHCADNPLPEFSYGGSL